MTEHTNPTDPEADPHSGGDSHEAATPGQDHATDGGTARATADSQKTNPDRDATPPATGAAAVIAALEQAGVDDAFGVQGGAIMPVYDELYESSVDHMTMAHEQGAAHAADAYGVVTGRPGVCLATSGPGATNLVTGIADASMDSDSLLALTGQVPTDFVGNDAFQETDTIGVTQPITKHNYFAGDSRTVGDMVSEAFALSETGRPGPTLVDLPKDTSFGEAGSQPAPPEAPAGTAPSPQANPQQFAVPPRLSRPLNGRCVCTWRCDQSRSE
jgi:Thiamine pyrophosphate-requiring enzymes [acetolactate synthase, pyruvate dehydrogenase (cytochrome), glyoxylate carboligase, phosphonopyruvate decarboxylase]